MSDASKISPRHLRSGPPSGDDPRLRSKDRELERSANHKFGRKPAKHSQPPFQRLQIHGRIVRAAGRSSLGMRETTRFLSNYSMRPGDGLSQLATQTPDAT